MKAIVLLLVLVLFTIARANAWPEVREIKKTIQVESPDSPKAGLELFVKGTDGRDLYKIVCHSGSYESDDDNEDFSGLIQCYVKSMYSKESVSNLLTETFHQVSDWQNRGRFLSNQLESGCSEFPEWGRLRHFLLRDMEITLAMSNVRFSRTNSSRPHVSSYDFTVTVRPMPEAASAIAEPANTPEPGWFEADECAGK